MSRWLKLVGLDELTRSQRQPVDTETLLQATSIVEDVRARGEAALREHSERLGDTRPGATLLLDRDALVDALEKVPIEEKELLERVANRIQRFAEAQRGTLTDLDIKIPGGRAGHRQLPVATAGAYAPGGRHPLPSSVLMTVIPARVAGVKTVWVASPQPTPVTLAAAAVAGADGLLAVGGAQAIAALAFGTLTPACDLVVGPGNRWVTAAKKHLYGEIGIDGLAGPSEIVVISDGEADADLVAADLLAQAEHDADAIPILITTSGDLADRVEDSITSQLSKLPTASTARAALDGGFCAVVTDLEEAVRLSEHIGPEHLALHVADAEALSTRFTQYGSMFIGSSSAEAYADYGVGPNHVLPTGGGARFQSGLSVATFLKTPTWLELDDPSAIASDSARLARIEGLEAHAIAAEQRLSR